MRFIYRGLAYAMLPFFGICAIFTAAGISLYDAMKMLHGRADAISRQRGGDATS